MIARKLGAVLNKLAQRGLRQTKVEWGCDQVITVSPAERFALERSHL